MVWLRPVRYRMGRGQYRIAGNPMYPLRLGLTYATRNGTVTTVRRLAQSRFLPLC